MTANRETLSDLKARGLAGRYEGGNGSVLFVSGGYLCD